MKWQQYTVFGSFVYTVYAPSEERALDQFRGFDAGMAQVCPLLTLQASKVDLVPAEDEELNLTVTYPSA